MKQPLPAGQYWVGDLCYVMHDVWDEVCRLVFPTPTSKRVKGVFTLKDGRKFALYSTAFGDGEYDDNKGNIYGVDSGSIGCILLRDIAEDQLDNLDQGCLHAFDTEVQSGEMCGTIFFNALCIDTRLLPDEDSGDSEDE